MNTTNESIITAAEAYATRCHAETNHLYDGKPYTIHLQAVADTVMQFVHLSSERPTVLIAAAWCHDVIEDTRQSYNDVKKAVGKDVADIVYALTTEKGRNRSERANDKYYAGILNTPGARLVKLADRIANVEYSLKTGSRMFALYMKEYNHFLHQLKIYNDPLLPMWGHLYDIFKNHRPDAIVIINPEAELKKLYPSAKIAVYMCTVCQQVPVPAHDGVDTCDNCLRTRI